jgi:hypothetical protein
VVARSALGFETERQPRGTVGSGDLKATRIVPRMSDLQVEASPFKGGAEVPTSDFVWGADDIGAVIGRDKSSTYYMLKRGLIKSARKSGNRWHASRSALLREFGA